MISKLKTRIKWIADQVTEDEAEQVTDFAEQVLGFRTNFIYDGVGKNPVGVVIWKNQTPREGVIVYPNQVLMSSKGEPVVKAL